MGQHQKRIFSVENAPKAFGPYSPVVQGGPFIFVSGQLGIEPQTGNLAEGITEQTRQALLNIKELLDAANSELANVVKTTVFLADIADFSAMNEIYAQFFSKEPPARSAFQVGALPKSALVEIEAIALKSDGCCD